MALPVNLEDVPVLPPAGLPVSSLDRVQKGVLALGHRIVPAYHPLIEPSLIEGRYVLVLRAPGGQNRPYKAPVSLAKDNKTYAYFIRKGACTVKARQEEEIELMSLAAQVPYDDRINQRASLQDLNLPMMKRFLREVDSALADEAETLPFESLCRKMMLVDGPPEHLLPRNVGLMFFQEQPERFFPQAQIDIVQFPEGLGGDRLIEKPFQGPLGQQLRDALLYLSNVILEETVIKRPDRAEADRFFNYPYAAIEEILVNAVYHRSYEIREPIEVRVLPDQITITSYPGPDHSISLRDLASGHLVARRYRNRRIGEFLKELRLTEGRGTGIPKVIRVMYNNGSPPPRFDTDVDRAYFTATLPIHPLVTLREKMTTEVTPQVTTEVEVSRLGHDPKIRVLLQYCVSPRDRASIQARLGLKSQEHVRRRYMVPAMAVGWLTMTDPEHPNSPTQKYRTTSQGSMVLEAEDAGESSS